MNKRFQVFFVFFCMIFAVSAKTVYVDNVKGKDSNPGTKELPVASVDKGLTLLKVSDCMEVINTGKPYQRSYPGGTGRTLAVGQGGTLEKPMVINGNGAVVTGLSVIPAEKWKKEGDFYTLFFYPMSNQYKLNKKANYWLDRTRIWWVDGKAAPNCKSLEELQK